MLDLLRKPTLLDLDDIAINGGTQPRAALNQETIAEYADEIRNGADFPPVIVYYDGKDHWLADGFHRYHAHRRAELTEIYAEIRQGTRRDAVLYSVSANSDHGLRRTNEDKRRAVLMLLQDPEWGKWGDREIARQCRVAHSFVSKQRAGLTGFESSERIYTTKHGTEAMMNTAPIAAANAKREAKVESQPIKRPGQNDEDTRLAAIRKVIASQPEAEAVIIDDLKEGRRGWYHEALLCYCDDTTPEEWKRIANKYMQQQPQPEPTPAPAVESPYAVIAQALGDAQQAVKFAQDKLPEIADKTHGALGLSIRQILADIRHATALTERIMSRKDNE